MGTVFELGRGVLYSSKSQLQLELVTSITVSAQQSLTASYPLSESDIRHLIQSGNACECQDSPFGFSLKIKMHGRPLASQERISSIINSAPVWEQLNLQPSLKSDTISKNSSSVDTETIQFDVSRLYKGSNLSQTPCDPPRPEITLPNTEPLGAIIKLRLHMVHFSLSITKAKRKPKHKRLKPTLFEQVADGSQQDVSLHTGPDSQWMLVESDGDEDIFEQEAGDYAYSTMEDRNVTSEAAAHSNLKRTLDRAEDSGVRSSVEEEELGGLVDASIRASVSARPRNLFPGIKILKTDFVCRLADIFPLSWCPGRLEAFQQRMPMLPILSRSLARFVSNARSDSLKAKFETLYRSAELPKGIIANNDDKPKYTPRQICDHLERRLSVFAQKRLDGKKPAGNLKPFVGKGHAMTLTGTSDDILEDCAFRGEKTSQLGSWLVEEEDEGKSGDSNTLEDNEQLYRMENVLEAIEDHDADLLEL